MIRLGVTGTDTGVGKTTIAAALIARVHALGRRVVPMKPVETGVGPGDGGDAARLIAAAGGKHSLADVSPYRLAEPLAPTVASRQAGITLAIEQLDHAFGRLSTHAELMVVEGAGGLLVPITRDVSFRTLFRRWNLEVIIVALNRLGVLNHVLLTVEAATNVGLTVRGIVLNSGVTVSTDRAVVSNLGELKGHVPGIPVIPFSPIANGDSQVTLAEAGVQLDPLIPDLLSPSAGGAEDGCP